MGVLSEGGKASDTGTATGMAVELWHRDKSAGTEDIIAAVENAARGLTERPPFPRADIGAAHRVLDRYRNDPRNIEADVPVWSLEAEVFLELPPHDSDKTGRPVCFTGHLDQVRRTRTGLLEVWDLKHSRFAGHELVAKYAWQQCVYAAATAATFNETVRWGGIVRTTGYLVRGAKSKEPDEFNVFYPGGFGPDKVNAVLDSIRLAVANIRNGDVALRSGEGCYFCPAGEPVGCIEDIKELVV